MRINSITTRVLAARPTQPLAIAGATWPEYSCVLVTVTSADGLEGHGESISRGVPTMVKTVIDDMLAPRLIGTDASNIGGAWLSMMNALRRFGHVRGLVMEGISGVDTALWDLNARAAGVPVWKLLAGVGRDTIPVYGSSVYIDEPAAMAKIARQQIENGFDRLKVKIGRGRGLREWRRDIEALGTIRDEVGPDVELYADANGAYDAATAINVARAMVDLNIGWFEEPLPPDDLEGYNRLHEQGLVPLARGETDFGVFDFARLVGQRIVDVIQPNSGRCGGITGMRQVYDLTYPANLTFAPHTGFSGGIAHAAALHIGAAAPEVHAVEYMFIEHPLRDIFVERFPAQTQGSVPAPTGPGWGWELDWTAVDRITVP